MVWSFKDEVRRKGIHILALFFIIIYLVFTVKFGEFWGLFSLTCLLLVFLVIDYFKIELGKKIPIFWRFFRDKEKDRLGGNSFFLIAAIIVFAVFDFRIALAAILMAIFGDIAAALIGMKFGRTWLTKSKALEGILAELVVDLLIGFLILDSFIVILAMALTATFVESVVSKIDDNFIVPIFSGFVGQIVSIMLKLI